MIAGALRLVSTVATVIVVLGFGLFAIDEFRYGSEEQQAKLAGISKPAPGPETERQREAAHGDARELLEDANDILLDPFTGLGESSSSSWVRRGIPALLAFLVYGLALRMLANFLPAPKTKTGGGWQEPR